MQMKLKSSLVSLVLLSGTGFMGAANAIDGKINFTGTITDAACTISPTSANQTKALGLVSSAALAAVGDTASSAKIDIVLSNCPAAATQASVKFDGPVNAKNPNILALTSGTGVATGVGVALYESDSSTLIPVGSNSKSQALSATADSTFTYIAKYMATDAVVSGTANATTDFTIIYN